MLVLGCDREVEVKAAFEANVLGCWTQQQDVYKRLTSYLRVSPGKRVPKDT